MHFRYWDIAKGREVRRFPKQGEVKAVAFGPKGETLVTADDATVRLWESTTGRPLRQYLGHWSDVFEVAIDADGNFVASGDAIGTLIFWDCSSGKELRRSEQPAAVAATQEGGSRYPEIPSIAFSPDRKTFAATDHRGASLFDAASGREVLRFPGSIEPCATWPSPRTGRRWRPLMDTGSCSGMWQPAVKGRSSTISRSCKPLRSAPETKPSRRWMRWAGSASGTWRLDDDCVILRCSSFGRRAAERHFTRIPAGRQDAGGDDVWRRNRANLGHHDRAATPAAHRTRGRGERGHAVAGRQDACFCER